MNPWGFYYSRAWFSADFPGFKRNYIFQPISGNRKNGSNIKVSIPHCGQFHLHVQTEGECGADLLFGLPR